MEVNTTIVENQVITLSANEVERAILRAAIPEQDRKAVIRSEVSLRVNGETGQPLDGRVEVMLPVPR